MKGYIQSLLGSLSAFVILIIGGIAAFVAFIAFMASVGSQPLIEVASDSVLVFDLNTTIQDAPPIAELGLAMQKALGGSVRPKTYLLKILDAIERAKNDPDISAILLHGNLQQEGYGSGLAAISEVRQALQAFKASGKPIYAYVVSPSQKDYYLSTVADEIWVNPFGMISMNGLATNAPYLGSTLKKYGIGVQTTRVGEYKSAIEIFTRESMSEADRRQKRGLLNDLWSTLLAEISTSRDIKPEEIIRLSNNDAFFTAEAAKTSKLVDKVGYLDELIEHLSTTHSPGKNEETFRQIDLIDYADARGFEWDTTTRNGDRIAIVYAEGEIIDGDYYPNYVGGDWLAAELRRLRQDPEVKAVVLRVNSPGGSAVASEIMQRETRLLAKEKPLIVSMGSYAASGGYWISAYSDKIYAQPYTITGSIGVFGVVFNIQKTAENFALQFDGVKTAPFADIYSASRPRTDAEMELIQTFTDEIYDAFIDKVAEGRSIPGEKVREIAQGRVWSGLSAKKIALVDETGGLLAAIHEAKVRSGLKSLAVEQVPAPSTLAETITELLEEVGAPPVARHTSPFNKIATEIEQATRQFNGLNDPRSVYTRMPYGFEGL